jgi:4-amino-4-deoxy-L-arabinose transferase-like glycosyltransferase
MNRKYSILFTYGHLLLIIGSFIVWGVLMIGQVFYLPIERDEGFYLMASQLSAEGNHPYLDFFYPQMPYLPVVYGKLFKLAGASLYTARTLSVIFSTLLLASLGWFVHRTHRCRAVALWALSLFAFQPLIFAWHARVKTYALSDLLMFLTFIFLIIAWEKKRVWIFTGLAGLCYGLAVSCRLIFAPLLPVLLAWLIGVAVRSEKPPALLPVLSFGFGAIIASFYSIWLLYQNPFTFWFANIRFHYLSHPDLPWVARMMQRFESIRSFWAHPPGIFLAVLAAAGAVLTITSPKTKLQQRLSSPEVLAGIILLTLLAIYLQMSPMYDQYFLQLFPYAVILSLPVLVTLKNRVAEPGTSNLKRIAVLVALVFFFTGTSPALGRILLKGRIGPQKIQSRTFDAVRKFMYRHAKPHDKLMTWWSGFAVQCGLKMWPNTEFGGAGYRVTDKLSTETVNRLHLDKIENTIKTLRTQNDFWIIDGIDTPPIVQPIIVERGRFLKDIGGVRIYHVPDLPRESNTKTAISDR